MDEAVNKTLDMVDLDETLLVVTADHGHTMSISGYQSRGADIVGVVDNQNATDDKPYMILSYANGKGFYSNLQVEKENVTRKNPETQEPGFTDFSHHYPS